MPNEQLDKETDGDVSSAYEDTSKHERTGFQIDRNDQIKKGDGELEGIDL